MTWALLNARRLHETSSRPMLVNLDAYLRATYLPDGVASLLVGPRIEDDLVVDADLGDLGLLVGARPSVARAA